MLHVTFRHAPVPLAPPLGRVAVACLRPRSCDRGAI
jgi:hypothetical protein